MWGSFGGVFSHLDALSSNFGPAVVSAEDDNVEGRHFRSLGGPAVWRETLILLGTNSSFGGRAELKRHRDPASSHVPISLESVGRLTQLRIGCWRHYCIHDAKPG